MSDLSLAAAQTIVTQALAHARANKFNPLGIVVLDARGSLKASAAEDGTSLMRWKVAFGKAYGSIAWGAGSKKIEKMAADRPNFFAGVAHLADGGILPVGGGVLIRDAEGRILGAVGVSGDTSDNDELAASVGVKAAGFTPDGGA
ncbi:MAG: GlcG/HbpS family heme-binding protein [Beijerinckiaceae bacterium]|jgi:uncharacterized protein GlcG (DUF336 family)